MVLFIDGDNSPGNRIDGIASLGLSDRLLIYYNSSNQYYRSMKNQHKIESEAGCPVIFISIAPCSNAVDFAIAIDAAISACKGECKTLVLVSEDKHFKTIAGHIQDKCKGVSVRVENNVYDAVMKYRLLELTSLDSFKKHLSELYGEEEGLSFYKTMEAAFACEFSEAGKVSVLAEQKMFAEIIKRLAKTFHYHPLICQLSAIIKGGTDHE